jgi:predicted methyltransferase
MTNPLRIFISSPVRGYKPFRAEILRCANQFRQSGKFDFFFYEEHKNQTEDGKTISQVIFENSGITYDAMFVSFKDRIGDGTQDELRFFKETIRKNNPNSKLWWCQAHCRRESKDVEKFKGELASLHGLELPLFNGILLLENEKQLADRFAAFLMQFLRD